jgi:hypothetical protein
MAYSSPTVSDPNDPRSPKRVDQIPGPPPNHAWKRVCSLLLAVTWLPLLGTHLYRTSLTDAGTGTAVVVFSPLASSADVFRRVMEADGSLVRPVSWLRRAWIVHSLQPGFAGRLREQGALGVYSTDLLSPRALFNCFRLADPATGPQVPGAPRAES